MAHVLDSLDAREQNEPHTYDGRRGNDIRFIGSASRGRVTRDYDIKVYSLMAGNATSKPTNKDACR